jgi:hypothetical protein
MNPILTAVVGDNGDLFVKAFPLFVPEGSKVVDMTWGKGVFWKKIEKSKYELIRNDIDPERGDVHFDFRKTDFECGSLDAVVLDPPYVGRSGSPMKASVDRNYNNAKRVFEMGIFGTDMVMQLYKDGMLEAYRILRKNGFLFVKCMDEIMGGKQRRNHITVHNFALDMGFVDEDMFTLVQKNVPTMRHTYQDHARKNNSFLWVFRKK